MKQQKLMVKFFVGTPLNKELSTHLEKSPDWHQAQAIKTPKDLSLVFFEGKEFLGYYLKQEHPCIEEIKEAERHFFDKLHGYLPKVRLRPVKLKLLSQVFVN